jgi:hypothetical protein
MSRPAGVLAQGHDGAGQLGTMGNGGGEGVWLEMGTGIRRE